MPPGTYVFFVALTPPAAFSKGRIDAGDILALDAQSLSFAVAEQAALAGVSATLSQLANVVNSKGPNLADTDLIGFFDANFLQDGFNRNRAAAEFATDLRGNTLNSIAVDRTISYDDTNKIISISFVVTRTRNGVTGTERPEGDFIFKQQAEGTWLLYGNQRLADIRVFVELRTDVGPRGTIGPRLHVNVDVRAPKDTVSAITVTGGGIFSNDPVRKSSVTEIGETLQPTPTTTLTIALDAFITDADLPSTFTSGTVFTVAVTPVSGPSVSYAVVSSGRLATEGITITSPTGHTLADAKLGQPLTVSWTLPQTFAIESIHLGGQVSTATGNTGFSCGVEEEVAPTATSGTITLPSMCNGQAAVEAGIIVSVKGRNGERAHIFYSFGP